MAQALWLSRRAIILQHVTFNHEMPVCDDPKQLALYIRYQTTNERTFHKCLQQLLSLRAEKRKQEIGFERQEHKRNEETRRQSRENRKQEHHRWDILLAEAKVDHQQLMSLNVRQTATAASLRENPPIAAEKAA